MDIIKSVIEDRIKLDYDSAIAQASNISEVADSLKKDVSLMSSHSNTLRLTWQGEASNVFAGRLSDITDEMNKTISKLNNISEKIRQTAENVKNAEMDQLNANAGVGGGSGGGGGEGGSF